MVHSRAPAKMVYRAIRGMVPYKTARGAAVRALVVSHFFLLMIFSPMMPLSVRGFRTLSSCLCNLCDVQAMAKLQVYEGVPEEFNTCKKLVVPNALKVLHSKVNRKTTKLGRLCTEVGWKHAELVKKLEADRAIKGKEYYAKKKEAAKLVAKASAAVTQFDGVLAGFGYYIQPTAVGATAALKAEFKSELVDPDAKKASEAE